MLKMYGFASVFPAILREERTFETPDSFLFPRMMLSFQKMRSTLKLRLKAFLCEFFSFRG